MEYGRRAGCIEHLQLGPELLYLHTSRRILFRIPFHRQKSLVDVRQYPGRVSESSTIHPPRDLQYSPRHLLHQAHHPRNLTFKEGSRDEFISPSRLGFADFPMHQRLEADGAGLLPLDRGMAALHLQAVQELETDVDVDTG